jgi:hypothetical protein
MIEGLADSKVSGAENGTVVGGGARAHHGHETATTIKTSRASFGFWRRRELGWRSLTFLFREKLRIHATELSTKQAACSPSCILYKE